MTRNKENDINRSPNDDDHVRQIGPLKKWPFWIGISGRFPVGIAGRFHRNAHDIPQNVNFAISAGPARAFLDAQSVPYETAPSTNELKPADIAAKARRFTVPVECWK